MSRRINSPSQLSGHRSNTPPSSTSTRASPTRGSKLSQSGTTAEGAWGRHITKENDGGSVSSRSAQTGQAKTGAHDVDVITDQHQAVGVAGKGQPGSVAA